MDHSVYACSQRKTALQCNVITCPCPWYLLLAHKSPNQIYLFIDTLWDEDRLVHTLVWHQFSSNIQSDTGPLLPTSIGMCLQSSPDTLDPCLTVIIQHNCKDLDKSFETFFSGARLTMLCCIETYDNLAGYLTITWRSCFEYHIYQCVLLWRGVWFINIQVWPRKQSNF